MICWGVRSSAVSDFEKPSIYTAIEGPVIETTDGEYNHTSQANYGDTDMHKR